VILHIILGVFMWGSGDKFLSQMPDQLAFFRASGGMHFEKKVLLSPMDIWRVPRKSKSKEEESCLFAIEVQTKEEC